MQQNETCNRLYYSPLQDSRTYTIQKNSEQAVYIEQLKQVNEELRNARRAALNLMEDAILSKDALRQSQENYHTQLRQEVRDRTAELNESREQYASLVENTPDIITRWNKDLKIVFANKASSDRWEEGIEKLLLPLNDGNVQDLTFTQDWLQSLKTVFASGLPVEHYHTVKRKTKDLHFFSRVVPERNAEGEVDTVLAIARDITDLRETEREILFLKDEIAQTATDKYLKLFNTMDEGFVLIGLLYDEMEKCVDYEFLEVNPTFAKQLGLQPAQVTGKKATELFSVPEDRLVQTFYELVSRSDTAHFEQYMQQNNCWYEVSAFAMGENQLAVLYNNITGRKNAEKQLRESELLKAYLLELSDVLRLISEPELIQAEAMRVLGDTLGVSRAQFFETDSKGEHLLSTGGYTEGSFALWSKVLMDDFGRYVKESFNAGRTLAVADVSLHASVDTIELENYRALGFSSFIGAPVIKNGKFIAGISVCSSFPRQWTPTEIAMVEETASRTWAAIDRALAHIALHENRELLARELEDTIQLQQVSNKIIEEDDVTTIYEEIVHAATKIMHSSMGSLQTLSTDGKQLLLLATQGFHPTSSEIWKYVNADSTSSCGHAFREQRRVIISDINNVSYPVAGHDLIAYQASGILAMQTTPLVSRSGKFVGMISTHWTQQYHPSERELRLLDVLARQAADLIERKSAEESLRENEQRTRTLTDAVPQIIWTNNDKGVADFFNRRWYEYSGLTTEESYGKGWEAIVHPDDAPASKNLWQKALASGIPFDSEYRLQNRDGSYRWHIGRNIPLKNRDGNISGWFGSATDIDDLKKAQEKFRLSEARLKATMDAASDYAIITIDTHGIISAWSYGAERIFGYLEAEVTGKPASLIFTPEDVIAGVPGREIETARLTGSASDERWHIRKDGSRFFMSGVMARLHQDELSGFVKVARDMTQQRLAQESIQSLEERYRIALQSAEMAAWDWNIPADVIEWNDQHFILLGLQPDNSRKKAIDLFNYVYPEDKEALEHTLMEAVNVSGIYKSEFRIVRNDNKMVRWMNGYGRVMTYENGKAIRMVGVMYDATERKELEQQKEDFISIASHELKTPVTSIRAYAELLSDVFEDTDDFSSASLIRKLNTQVDKLTDLIHALLDTSKISFGELTLNKERFDLNSLIEECMEDLNRLAESHTLIFTPADDGFIVADRERIGQVLINLIANAIKYSPFTEEVYISCTKTPEHMIVKIRDKGIGITPEMQARIFERFFRVYDPVASTQSGMGLGLYITSNIIERHGGRIWVESTAGEGSTFSFTLPATLQ